MSRGPIPKPPGAHETARSHRRARSIVQIEPVGAPPPPPVSLGKTGQQAWIRWWGSAT
jgi:hypothetical protein